MGIFLSATHESEKHSEEDFKIFASWQKILSVYRKKPYMIFDDLALTKFSKPHFTGFSGVILTKSTALCPHWGYQFTDGMLLRVWRKCSCFWHDPQLVVSYTTYFQQSPEHPFAKCHRLAEFPKFLVPVSWHSIFCRSVSGIICPMHSICWKINYWNVHQQTNNLLVGCVYY